MPFSPIFRSAERGSTARVPAVETVPFPFKRRERPSLALLLFAVEIFSPLNVRFCATNVTGLFVVWSTTRMVYLSISICFRETSHGFSDSMGFSPVFGFLGGSLGADAGGVAEGVSVRRFKSPLLNRFTRISPFSVERLPMLSSLFVRFTSVSLIVKFGTLTKSSFSPVFLRRRVLSVTEIPERLTSGSFCPLAYL